MAVYIDDPKAFLDALRQPHEALCHEVAPVYGQWMPDCDTCQVERAYDANVELARDVRRVVVAVGALQIHGHASVGLVDEQGYCWSCTREERYAGWHELYELYEIGMRLRAPSWVRDAL